jgi:ABC-type dipeptide/oligopeptide/nickel transport system permease subunit
MTIACVVLGLIILLAVAWPIIAPANPDAVDLRGRFSAPSSAHLLGTDELGRDVLSRVGYGARISLVAAFVAVGVAVGIGIPLGLIAGFARGWLDAVLGRIHDAVMSIPPIILAIAVVAALGPGVVRAMVAVGLIFAPRVFRVTRAATLSVSREPYVEAATVAGAPGRHVIVRHVIPNIAPPLLVQVSFLLGAAIIAEASLSFLGLGVQPPSASLGTMLQNAVATMQQAPWLLVAPGLVITLTVLSFNFIGDGLSDVLGGRA